MTGRRKTFDLGLTVDRGTAFTLPNEFAGRRSAIFGISGSGKSNSATVCIEGLVRNGEQVVLIDPKGEGYGLRSLDDGTPSDLDIILFGEPNGDIEAINEHHGEALADLVVETGRSMVLSMLGFGSDQSERRFVAQFLRRLYRRKSKTPHPGRTLVIFEEAHLFIPESAGQGHRGDVAELAGAVQRVVRQGRSCGIGSLLVDQRPQDVAKRAISQCDTLICHRLVHNRDRDALRDWVRGYDNGDQGEIFLNSLASLADGEAWIWSPAWVECFERVQMARRMTFDTGAAPDPSTARSIQRTKIDLDSLRDQFESVIDEAKANDPNQLKIRIRELEQQLKEVTTRAPTKEEIKPHLVEIERRMEVEVTRYKEAIGTAIQPMRDWLQKVHKQLVDLAQSMPQDSFAKVKLPDFNTHEIRTWPAVQSTPPIRRQPPILRPSHVQTDPGLDDVKLGKAEKLILRAFYWLQGEEATKAKVAFYSGYSAGSGGFNNALGRLRTAGFLNGWRITGSGVAVIGQIGMADPKPTGSDLREWLRPKLGKAENAILDVLINAHGRRLQKDELAEQSGYAAGSGGFNNAIGKLRSIEAAEGYERDGGTKASEVFFK